MGDTEISWTHRPGTRGRSWNPTQGCALKSEGCRNCYAMRMAARFAKDGWSKGLIHLKTGKWNGEARLALHKLAEPMSWRDPSTVFVNSMSDLFYEGFTNEEIAAVFGVMAACPQHTFQVLTKRAARMREWFEWLAHADVGIQMMSEEDIAQYLDDAACNAIAGHFDCCHLGLTAPNAFRWPLPNVWLGVSVEDQAAADERIPELLRTPSAVRFLSCEPLIGAVDVSAWLRVHPLSKHRTALDWIIAGCESGPGARACDLLWVRSLRDQCLAAGVPVFVKQLVDTGSAATNGVDSQGQTIGVTRGAGSSPKGHGFGGPVIERPYLDNVQHLDFPKENP